MTGLCPGSGYHSVKSRVVPISVSEVSLIHTLGHGMTSCDVAGGQEHHSPMKPSDLMKDMPGRRQFYHTKVGVLR